MPAPAESSPAPQPDLPVPLTNVTRFLRQFIHDLRNHLNAAELQSAYLAEINPADESREEVKRLRTTLAHLSADLQAVAKALSEPRLTKMPYVAADFVDDLRQRVTTEHPDHSERIEWPKSSADAKLQIDPELLLGALAELFANAFRHGLGPGKIIVGCAPAKEAVFLTIREPKNSFESATHNWGNEPMQSISKGHYGLGLFRSRAIIEAHGGRLTAHYDTPGSSLVTTIQLPLEG